MSSDPNMDVRFSAGDGADAVAGEMTFRVLAIADLVPGYEGKPVAVDKNSFAEVLEGFAFELDLTVADKLGTGKKEIRVPLRIGSLKDFHPDGIVANVPLLAGLGRARKLLESCLQKETDLETVRGELIEAFGGTDLAASLRGTDVGAAGTVDPGAAEAPGGLDALLSQVDLPKGVSSKPSAASLAEILTSAMATAPAGPSSDPKMVRDLIAEIDSRLTRQVAAICAAPAFLDKEAAWKGLKFLVDRTDFRSSIRMEVLPAERDDFLPAFYEECFQAEYENLSDVPLSLVLADYAFGRSQPHLQAVQDAARMAESLSLPFVMNMSPEFWGVRQPKLVGSLPDLMDKARGSEYAKWMSFRKEDASLWIGLAANRFALRSGWGETTPRVKSFAWTPEGDATATRALWGSGVWAMGASLTGAFAEGGITFPCTGADSPGALEGLPLTEYQVGRKGTIPFPLEVRYTDKKSFELSQCGFAPLISQADTDTAHFQTAPTFHKPARYDTKEATRASFLAATLPYQVFAGIASHTVRRIGQTVGGGLSEEQIKARFQTDLLALVGTCEEGPQAEEVEIEITANEEVPELADVAIRIKPQFTIYGGEVDLMVGTSVPR